ncbi:MAG: CrcB family protein [Pirellulaceae bacterium]
MRWLIDVGLVAGGSALGGLARWSVALVASRWFGTALPLATFLVNIVGSFLLGWLLTVLHEQKPVLNFLGVRPEQLRLAIAVGFTGGLTTFSTFEWESYGLIRDRTGLSIVYMSGSLLLGLTAVRCGVLLARAM